MVERRDLQRIIDYLEVDEMRDWEEKGRQKEHIYLTIKALKRQLRNPLDAFSPQKS